MLNYIQTSDNNFTIKSVELQEQLHVEYVTNRKKGQLHTAAKPQKMLSKEKFCLAVMGYQPRYHTTYIASNWSSAGFCLASKFAQQNVLLISSIKLALGHIQ